MNGITTLSIKLTCEVQGHPLPDIYWFKNGTIIDTESLGSGVNFNIDTSKINDYRRRSSLTLFDLDYEDDGNYHCTANNTLFEYKTKNSTQSVFRVHCELLV